MKTTIKDVSLRAGVSITSVSQVLNGKDIRISDSKRKLIIKAAEDLNYTPNPFASKLKSNRSNMVGVILPDISNPYFVEIAKGIITRARESNIEIIITDSDNITENDLVNFDRMRSAGVDGIIISSSGANNTELNEIIQVAADSEKFPLVLLDRDNINYNCNSVLIDNYIGGYIAGKHLLELGHEKIICVLGPVELNSTKNRLKGFKKALEEFNIPFNQEYLCYGNYSLESGYSAVETIGDKNFTAIFAFNDLMAFGAIKYFKEKNIEVPEKVSIIGFDNISFSEYFEVPLTTVGQPIKKLGERAFDLLLNSLDSDDSMKTNIILEPSLVLRASTSQRYDFFKDKP